MIEITKDKASGVVAVHAVGLLTNADYDATIVPLLDEATRTGQHIRCLIQVGPEFRGLTPGAAWEDVRLGLRGLRLFEACAVVSDLEWVRGMSRLVAVFMPCPMQVFSEQDREQAVKWLSSMPEKPRIEHRLIPESGVVVVEVSQPLRETDFDALGMTVDAWLETHDELRGLVLHTKAFAGWENIGGLVRHIRFVHDHHRKIRRVAVVVDGPIGALGPRAAEHFVQAEIRGFAADQLDDAVAWAAGPAE
jgi:SpoIIAA-like